MTDSALAPVTPAPDLSVIHDVIATGDLAKLTDEQRTNYYVSVCTSVGLNPLTQPFAYIELNRKLVLYALKGATDQLRALHGINITDTRTEYMGELIVVTVFGQDRTGRQDSEIGAVTIGGLRGDAKANAIMKALTKAKRRLTLSMCGLGMLDESEVETIPGARPVPMSPVTETIDADGVIAREDLSWVSDAAPPARTSERRSRFTPVTAHDSSGGPVERQANADREQPVTEPTMRKLHAFVKDAFGWEHTDLSIFACHAFKRASMKDLTELEAKTLHSRLAKTSPDRANALLLQIVKNQADAQPVPAAPPAPAPAADDPAANFIAAMDAGELDTFDSATFREL